MKLSSLLPTLNFCISSQSCLEAAASLQSAAAEFLRENGHAIPSLECPFVAHDFAVEIDKSAQKVLGNTYNCCCFGDILTFDVTKSKEFCVTHGNSTIALLSPFQPSPCPQDCPSMQLARASALDGLNQCAMIRWINPVSMTWHT